LSKVSCRTFLHVAVEHLAKIYIHEITTNEFQIAFTLLLKLLADKSFDFNQAGTIFIVCGRLLRQMVMLFRRTVYNSLTE
jgi:hypothetical protein